MSQQTPRPSDPSVVAWPNDWPAPKWLSGALISIFFGLATAACVIATVTNFGDAQAMVLTSAIPFLAGITLVGVSTRLGVRARSSKGFRTARTDGDGPALLVPFKTLACAAMLLMAVGGVLLGGVFAVVSIAGAVGSSINVGALLIGLVLAVIAIASLSVVIEVLLKRLKRGALEMSPKGVTYRSWSADMTLEWGDIVEIDAMPSSSNQTIGITPYGNSSPEIHYRSILWRPRKNNVRALMYIPVNATQLAADPALTLRTLQFYFRNPAARSELGTDAAIQRVQAGAVATM